MLLNVKNLFVLALAGLSVVMAFAKLPAASEEAKAKAAEAATKTAWSGKVDAYLLCKAQDRSATNYQANAKKSRQAVSAPVATAACTDPGPYVAAAASSAPVAAPSAMKKG